MPTPTESNEHLPSFMLEASRKNSVGLMGVVREPLSLPTRIEPRSAKLKPESGPAPNNLVRRPDFSRRGKPGDNARNEGFNRSVRREVLSQHCFLSLLEAQQELIRWRREYNNERPHGSLEQATPSQYREARMSNRGPAEELLREAQAVTVGEQGPQAASVSLQQCLDPAPGCPPDRCGPNREPAT